ncbi:uncharacterized protein HD556DRAFT_1309235 [Suillus plorans]|uniref:Uncharacterized protein n=1 Tax=Suillus plorans TaxID=116603 RepID=A0A9P7APH4_9AGAM|nr:uncharacterized protein HD556DRAFT_1309235 [Suillus plorans]KAG1792706.1 hypothetical protein HD556DRAFT_1309235 [Suillus plorans]
MNRTDMEWMDRGQATEPRAYLCVQLGFKALYGMCYDEATDHFTDTINSDAFSSKPDIHEMYKDFAMLFGWDLKSLWQKTHQKQCHALLQAASSGKNNKADLTGPMAKLGKMLWIEALLDAQKVIKSNPSSHIGYMLKHAAFHGTQHYDEAIVAFQTMFSKLSNASDSETQKLCQQYLSLSEVDCAIQMIINAQIDNAPLHVHQETCIFPD